MRKALLTSVLLAGSAFAAAPALADDPAAPPPDFTITGSAGVWSQYRFRGISQSDNKPVFQGSFTVTHKSGFYLSTWGSSATDDNAVALGGTEIDAYGGYSKTVAGFTLDGGLYGYIYPGSGHAVGISENYFEVYGDVSKTYGPVTAKLGVNWAPNQSYFKNFGTPTRYNMYGYGELSFAVPNSGFLVHSHVGHTGGGLDYIGHPYWDFVAGASYKWKALTADVSFVGTSVKGGRADAADAAFNLANGVNQSDFYRAQKNAVMGSISASF